ncbi:MULTISPECIES: HNH endonuclease [unclassified Gordonia (in: high G+C Gram-positive bacteria)]|uniref:HNH endonuclease n=1 Tax=unclassified Gordonia (in: high G+C Gram-positive bacteria) TaxID=2657482 RepID=UPI000FAAD728|nr:HNH endonuclease signature motif containing protein [Gordonia sp. UBA7599]RUP38798.1 MAG: HNH endonuclease [Gordonia sp. (in: high G+C Gram-positive bacteria)]HNP58414.1 HNH endonuclease signature motif containing protein [Gordonia sp. (in: high G+C Gram-positive bacteria)]
MVGKRPHAVYCSRQCKTRASDRRRRDDGRSRKRDRERYAAEGGHRREYARSYLAENPDRCREYRRRRKARLRGAQAFQFSDADWKRTLNRYRFCCAYCGESGPLTMDHVVPISRGGRHSIGNVVPACGPCNFGKHTSLAIEWRRRLDERRGVMPDDSRSFVA